MNTSISSSFRRHVRGGVESQQLDQLSLLLDTVILSNMDDRWFWDLNGGWCFSGQGMYRSMLDEVFSLNGKFPVDGIKRASVESWRIVAAKTEPQSAAKASCSLLVICCCVLGLQTQPTTTCEYVVEGEEASNLCNRE
ncbi:hypothetical protein Tco_0743460 [Tanacetum coccineum]